MNSDFAGLDDDPQMPGPEDEGNGRLRDEIYADTQPDRIVTRAPKPPFRLGFYSVACLCINRMIGTGIFNSPKTVMTGTNSTGITLIFWFIGIIYCMCGVYVYIEYGLNIPRYVINSVEQSVPRSGGDINYLQYVYRKPRYNKDTIVFVGCLFGISFICIGNMAGNCISFALRVLEAADPNKDEFAPGTIRVIAIAVATFACFVHAFSRRGGILLNNILATIKILILLLIVVAAILVSVGVFKNEQGEKATNEIGHNTYPSDAFGSASGEANGYAQAFLSIIFAFSGFDQPNYVLGEIARPRKTFPRAMYAGVGLVCVLYMAVNICYMVVVPHDDQVKFNVAQQFFKLTFGRLQSGDSKTGERIFNSLLAISSFGNIVVMTYTAARMKQEIAKQGFLPFSPFFARNRDFSLGRFLWWLEAKGMRISFLDPTQHSELTPVGALLLHFLSCLVLIFATYSLSADDAYSLLSSFISYVPNAWFGSLLAFGILWLHIWGPPSSEEVDTRRGSTGSSQSLKWSDMIRRTGIIPWLSKTCATLYLVGNLFPVITVWIPKSSRFTGGKKPAVAWFVSPTICWCVLAFAALWWCGWMLRARYKKHSQNLDFVYSRVPQFDWADEDAQGDPENLGRHGAGDLILARETVHLSWQGHNKDGLDEDGMEMGNGADEGMRYRGQERGHEREQRNRGQYFGTDFASMDGD